MDNFLNLRETMADLIQGLKVKIGDKIIHIISDADTSIQHYKDALVHFMGHIAHIEDGIKAEAEAKTKAEAEKATVIVEDPPKEG